MTASPLWALQSFYRVLGFKLLITCNLCVIRAVKLTAIIVFVALTNLIITLLVSLVHYRTVLKINILSAFSFKELKSCSQLLLSRSLLLHCMESVYIKLLFQTRKFKINKHITKNVLILSTLTELLWKSVQFLINSENHEYIYFNCDGSSLQQANKAAHP